MAEAIEYSVGDWIYMNSYSDSMDDVDGGLVQIASLETHEITGDLMAKFEFFPKSHSYNLASKEFADQEKLAEKFGDRLAELTEHDCDW